MKKGVWVRSSESGSCESGSCVEVMCVDGKFLVRDSKDPLSPVLTFNPEEWDAFIRGAHDGQFDI